MILTASLLTAEVCLMQIYQVPQGDSVREIDSRRHLFGFDLISLEKLSISIGDDHLVFSRSGYGGQDWQMEEPEKKTANPAALSYLSDLLFGNQQFHSFVLVKGRLNQYGLDHPLAVVELRLKNKQIYHLRLGNILIDGKSIYGQIDNRERIYVLPIEFKYAVDRSLGEWKQSAASGKGKHNQS